MLVELTILISFGPWRTDGEFLGIEKKCCSNGWGWESNAAGTDGDGNNV